MQAIATDIPVPQLTDRQDGWGWDKVGRKFSVKKALASLQKLVDSKNGMVLRGSSIAQSGTDGCHPSYSSQFGSCRGMLPTQDRLVRMVISDDETCSLCEFEPESHSHLFLYCNFAIQLWRFIWQKFKVRGGAINDIQQAWGTWEPENLTTGAWFSKRKVREPKEENITLGPAVRDGEHVFGVAHIFASFKDTVIFVTGLSGGETMVRITAHPGTKLSKEIFGWCRTGKGR